MEGNQAIQGYTAGVVEMLMQSHAGEIELLPALPKAWAKGSIKGLRARGAYGIDLAWDQGRLTSATLRSNQGGTCRLRVAGGVVVRQDGRELEVRRVDADVIEFTTVAGGEYTVLPRS
jgi:alpha-L-fucosidase 2